MADETEVQAKFVDKIRRNMNRFFFGAEEKPKMRRTTEYEKDGSVGGFMRMLRKWYIDMLAETGVRGEKYDKYRFLDDNLAEAAAGLNIYADNIVSGSIGGVENYSVVVEKENAVGTDRIEACIKLNEQASGIKDMVWEIGRDLTQMGDRFDEVVVREKGGQYFISKLKKLPTKEMYADVDSRGVFKDPTVPYYQKPEDFSAPENKIPFDWWRVIHFKIGSGVYGVDNSLFANASQRIGRQLLWIDDSIVLARMSRAWQRYAYMVDTSGMSADQKWEFLEEFKSHVKTKEVVDQETGRINMLEAPPLPDEDIFLPVSENSKQDVKVLTGDLNIGNIGDVKYFQTKFFMVISMPKAYASTEEGTRSKATLSQLDVQFARQVRRRQRAMIPGLRQFYSTAFYLSGIDPESFKWDVVFPELATADELMKWEMYKLKAEVAKIMHVDIGLVNLYWIAKVLLEMTDEEIADYTMIGDEPEEFEKMNLTPELKYAIKRDPEVRSILNDLKDLILMKKARAEKLVNMKQIGLEREIPVDDNWK